MVKKNQKPLLRPQKLGGTKVPPPPSISELAQTSVHGGLRLWELAETSDGPRVLIYWRIVKTISKVSWGLGNLRSKLKTHDSNLNIC